MWLSSSRGLCYGDHAVGEFYCPGVYVAAAAFIAGWTLCGLGVFVRLGWTFHVVPLIAVVPGLATMKANTAIAFLLSGAALIRRNHRDHIASAVGVLMIGALSLSEYVSEPTLVSTNFYFVIAIHPLIRDGCHILQL